jgi:DNA modification methylase
LRENGTEVIPVNDEWDKFESYEDYDNFTEKWIKECQRLLKPTGTIWIMGMYHKICRGPERLKDENGIKAHSTQKPLKLIQQVLLSASKKDDLILDPFLGSGTTAIVAKALGRNWIGIEKEKKYVDLANKRILALVKN